MVTAELIKEISTRTGIPESKVRRSVFDFCRDCTSIIGNKSTGGFTIPNIGYVALNIRGTFWHMSYMITILEREMRVRSHLLVAGSKYIVLVTRMIDTFYACATLILENNIIKNEEYNRGAGKKVEVNPDLFKQYMDRMEVLLTAIPVELERKEYTEIQKVLMRRLRKQGVLQSPGKEGS